MENFEQYRSDLAEKIKKAPKEERRSILEEAKKTEEYKEAREEKLKATSFKRQGEDDSKRILELKTELGELGENITRPEALDPDKARTWRALEQKIDMPHVSGISEIVAEQYKKENADRYDPEIVKDVLYCFLEKGIDNTKMFNSEKHEASFPYTTFNTAEIAKALYRVYSGHEIGKLKSTEGEESAPKKRKEFLFGSFQLISHGNQFTFTEQVLSQIFKDLPVSIEKIENGEEPDVNEISILGSPTTLTGTMSPKFLDEIKNGAFEAYGDMYAELVESMLPKGKTDKENTSVMFRGVSMGASFAGQTARKVLEDGYATQSREDKDLPFMQIRIDTAPGHRNKPGLVSKIKLFGGFAISAVHSFATDSYIRKVMFKNGKYMDQVNQVLAEKGLAEDNLTPEQVKMKKSAIGVVENALAEGVPWPEGVKATEVVGLQDLLTYDSSLNKSAYKQRTEHTDSLGTTIIPEQDNDDIRVRSAKMTHAIPFAQRENEKRRMFAGVESLDKLKKKYSKI